MMQALLTDRLMVSAKPTCQFQPRYKHTSFLGVSETYQCEHPLERDGLCIFHVPKNSVALGQTAVNQKAEEEKFRQGFNQLILDVETNNSSEKHNFRGFNFPFISLSKIVFGKEADFQEAVFNSYVSFYSTKFRKRVDFYDAMFEWGVLFDNCTFNQEAYFFATEFKHNCSFSKTAFEQTATFSAAEFSNSTSFFHCTFNREAEFAASGISGETWFIGESMARPFFVGEADFTGLRLAKESVLGFEKVNLGMARFLDTNLGEIIVRDVQWRLEGHQEKAYPLLTRDSILDWPDLIESLKHSDSLQPPMREYINWHEQYEREHPGGLGMAAFLKSTHDIDAPDPKRIIKDSFSDECKVILSQFDRNQDLDEASKSLIIRDLNSFLETKNFYNEDSFHSTYPDDEAKTLLVKGTGKISSKDRLRLNRLLIEAVFPYDIAKRKRQLRGRKENALWDEFRPSKTGKLDANTGK